MLAARPALSRACLSGALAGAPRVLAGLSGGPLWAEVRAGIALSVLGVVVAWALAMAGAAAEAVATQRSRFGTGPSAGLYPPSDADLGVALDKLLPLLGGRGGALDQALAFQEVCTLAELGGPRGRSWLKQCVLGGGGRRGGGAGVGGPGRGAAGPDSSSHRGLRDLPGPGARAAVRSCSCCRPGHHERAPGGHLCGTSRTGGG